MKISRQPVWVSSVKCDLGENPLWDSQRRELHWIDVTDPAIHVGQTDARPARRIALPRPPASLYLGRDQTLLLALRNSFALVDLVTAQLTPIETIRPPSPEERFNDGRCDRHGNLWISTMDRKVAQGIGSLVCVADAAIVQTVATGAKLGNGVCFSLDDRFLYFSDTHRRTIFRYEKSGASVGTRTVFAELDAHPGRPDGCAVDVEGCLWSARAGGGRIDRYAPDGRLIDTLEVPASHPTHCTFGGPDLSTLFVTTAARLATHASPDGLDGCVLAFDAGVQGHAEAHVTGDRATTARKPP